jgi:hypothetical protein
MAKVDLDGGPSSSAKRDARERLDVHRLMNRHRSREPAFRQNGWKGARQCRILGHGEASSHG